jgi:hypothetical protein
MIHDFRLLRREFPLTGSPEDHRNEEPEDSATGILLEAMTGHGTTEGRVRRQKILFADHARYRKRWAAQNLYSVLGNSVESHTSQLLGPLA